MRPQGYVHILGVDNKTVFTFQIWYEGFSPGCGSCGEPDHLFENCFLHRLQHEVQQLNPTAHSGEADNAKQTKQLLARHFMNSQMPRSAPDRRANLVGNSSLSASHRQQQAFRNRALPSSSTVQRIESAPQYENIDSRALVPASDATPNSTCVDDAASELLNKMRQMAILMDTPHFKSLMGSHGKDSPSGSSTKNGSKTSPKRKEDKAVVALLELAAHSEEIPDDPKEKGKAIAVTPPKGRNKRQRKNNGGALTIPGFDEE